MAMPHVGFALSLRHVEELPAERGSSYPMGPRGAGLLWRAVDGENAKVRARGPREDFLGVSRSTTRQGPCRATRMFCYDSDSRERLFLMFADHHFNRRHRLRNVEPVFRVFVALKFPTQIDGFVLARKVKETGPFAIRQLLDRNLVIRHIFYSLLWRFRRETMRAGNRASAAAPALKQ